MDKSDLNQWSMGPQNSPTDDNTQPKNKISSRLAKRGGNVISAHLPGLKDAKQPKTEAENKTSTGNSQPKQPDINSNNKTSPGTGNRAKGKTNQITGSASKKMAGAAAKKVAGSAAKSIATQTAAGAAGAAATGGASLVVQAGIAAAKKAVNSSSKAKVTASTAGAVSTGGMSLISQAGISAAKKAAAVVTSRTKTQTQTQAKATGHNAKEIEKGSRGPITKLLIIILVGSVALGSLFGLMLTFGAAGQSVSFTAPGSTLTSSLHTENQAPSTWVQDAVQAGEDTSTPWPILLAIGYVTTEWGQVNPYGGTTSQGIGSINSSIQGAGPMLLSSNFVGDTWPAKLSTAMQNDPLDAMNALGAALNKTGQQAAADHGISYGTIVSDPFGTGGAAPGGSSGNQTSTQPDTSSPNMKAWLEAVEALSPDIEPGICKSMAGGEPSPTYIYQCGQGTNSKGTAPILDWTTNGKSTNAQGVAQTDFANITVEKEAPLLAGFSVASSAVPGLGVTVSSNGTLTVPPTLIPIFQAAASTCPGLSWILLAADSYQESRWNPVAIGGGPTASSDGLYSYGMAQFETRTFNEYSQPVAADRAPNPPQGASPPTPFDPWDAEFAAARYLCSLGVSTNPDAALGGYNAGSPNLWDTAYIDMVLLWEADIEAGLTTSQSPQATTQQLSQLISFAIKTIGTPYLWGGTGNGGFDCSGLTQAAAAAAGITIPRTSELQWEKLAHTTNPVPGDLVFYYFPSDNQTSPNHVGIYIGGGQMIDAPSTGYDVRIDPIYTANLVGYATP